MICQNLKELRWEFRRVFAWEKRGVLEKPYERLFFRRKYSNIRGIEKEKNEREAILGNFSERLRGSNFWRKREKKKKEGGEILIENVKKRKRNRVGEKQRQRQRESTGRKK